MHIWRLNKIFASHTAPALLSAIMSITGTGCKITRPTVAAPPSPPTVRKAGRISVTEKLDDCYYSIAEYEREMIISADTTTIAVDNKPIRTMLNFDEACAQNQIFQNTIEGVFFRANTGDPQAIDLKEIIIAAAAANQEIRRTIQIAAGDYAQSFEKDIELYRIHKTREDVKKIVNSLSGAYQQRDPLPFEKLLDLCKTGKRNLSPQTTCQIIEEELKDKKMTLAKVRNIINALKKYECEVPPLSPGLITITCE